METHAELWGIDPDKLNEERFGSYTHLQLVKRHMDRVRAYAIEAEYMKMQEAIARRAVEDKKVAEELRERRNRNRRDRRAGASKRSEGYQFTDKQMEIALRSLQRHAETE